MTLLNTCPSHCLRQGRRPSVLEGGAPARQDCGQRDRGPQVRVFLREASCGRDLSGRAELTKAALLENRDPRLPTRGWDAWG